MEYESRVTIIIDGNNIEADNIEDYLIKLKESFKDEFNIDLVRDEIMIYGVDDK